MLVCKRYWVGILAFLMLMIWMSSSLAFTTLPPQQKPIKVAIGLHIDDFTNIDQRFGLIEFEGSLKLSWRDSRLAFDPAVVGSDVKSYKDSAANTRLHEIWKPQIEIKRARGKRETELQHLTIRSDGLVTYREQFHAAVEEDFDLRQFPFDTQTLSIILSPFAHSSDEVELVLAKKGGSIGELAPLEEWNILGVSSKVSDQVGKYADYSFSTYVFSVQYERESGYYVFQVMLLLICIVLASFSIFWMLDQPIVNRVGISFTAMLTVVVFQWQVFRYLPHLGYHTFLDTFFLYSFVVVALTIVGALILYYLKWRGKFLWACRILFPVVYLLGIAVLLWAFAI